PRKPRRPGRRLPKSGWCATSPSSPPTSARAAVPPPAALTRPPTTSRASSKRPAWRPAARTAATSSPSPFPARAWSAPPPSPCAGNRFVSVDGQRRRQHATFTQKMVNAEKRDALGILFVNDADTAKDGDDLLDFNFTATARVPVKMPAFHLHRSVLETMLAGSGAPTLSEIEKDIDRELKPHSL